MNKLEMLIQSAEGHYDSSNNIYYYHLSCSLLNIYKGRCSLFITNNKTNIKQVLKIKHDRAIMEGNLKVKNSFFKALPYQLFSKNEKPAKIEIEISNSLNVNKDGVLLIDRELTSKIMTFKFIIPFK